MAIRTFNSVGGFSVGEIPTSVILPNGDVTTGNARLTSNVIVGNIITGSGNITVGNTILTGNLRTDNLLYANGATWDLQQAAGSNNQIQYNVGNDFGANANLAFYPANGQFVTSHINVSGNIVAANLLSNTLTSGRIVISNSNLLTDAPNLKYDTVTQKLTAVNFETLGDTVIGGNLTVQGTLTSLETTNTTIEDNTVVLNKGETGSGVSSGTSGLEIDRGTSNNTTLLWTESSNAWVFKYGTANANIVAGNASISGDVSIGNSLYVTANLIARNISGNLYGNIYGNVNANLSAPGADTQILFNDANAVQAASGLTYNKTSNLVTLSGNISVNNVTNISNIAFSNGGYINQLGNGINITALGTASKVELKTVDGANTTTVLANANGVTFVAGTGTLSFSTNGNLITSGNISASTGLITGNSLYINTTANVRGDTTLGGNLSVSSQTTIGGNVTIGNVSATANANISGNLYVGVDANIAGALTIGNLNVRNYVNSNLIPGIAGNGDANTGYSLGTQVFPWKDLWLSSNAIHLGTANINANSSGVVFTSNQSITQNLYAGNIQTNGYVFIGNASVPANLVTYGTGNISNTTVSTNTTTGALVVAGGAGIGGNLNVGGITNILGNLLVGNASSPKDANITQDIIIGRDANVGGNLSISGNLLVTGTTTYLNVQNIDSKDSIMSLGGPGNAAELNSPTTKDSGLFLRNYYTGTPSNQFMGWSTASKEFQLLSSATLTNEVASGTFANLHIGVLNSANVYGRIETVNQPNVTTMSGLTDIAVSNVANINIATIGNLVASGLRYPLADGTNGQLLTTYGNGKLYFSSISQTSISNGSSNINIASSNISLTANGHTSLVITDTGANVIGNLNVTGSVTLGNISVGEISPTTVKIGNSSIRSNTITTTSVTPGQIIAEVNAFGVCGIEFFVKGEDNTGLKYSIATVAAVHNGTDIAYDVYGTVNIGGYVGKLSASYAGGKIQLIVTPSSTNPTVWTTQFKTI
jgi:carbonic anhydrase/acetyltransferase-like protein (isoleucine patch superfamily)